MIRRWIRENVDCCVLIAIVVVSAAIAVWKHSDRPHHFHAVDPYEDEWRTMDWGRKRGIQSIDTNNYLLLVAAPVEDVAKVLSEKASSWERDALGRTVTYHEFGCIVFRIRGQAWTEVLTGASTSVPVADLSRALRTRVIEYTASDTTGATGYTYYDDGEVLEEFFATEGEDEILPDRFRSKLRSTTLAETGYLWDWTWKFFVEQDAFDPGLEYEYFFNHRDVARGARVKVENPGVTVVFPDEEITSIPPMERVDYLVFPDKR